MKENITLGRYSMEASPQVFINFRGEELRHGFIAYLSKALVRNGINAFIDTYEEKGRNLNVLFKRIENSKIALAVISPMYTESIWCLDELVKMKECAVENKLAIIPIFYKVSPHTVENLMADFGDKFRELVHKVDEERERKWIDALKYVPTQTGISYDGKRDEDLLIGEIVKEVHRVLKTITLRKGEEEQNSSKNTSSGTTPHNNKNIVDSENQNELAGLNKRLEELKEKLDLACKETLIIGVFGMPGIGKTTLVKKLYDELKHKFQRHVHMVKIREKSDAYGTNSLQRMLLKGLLSDTYHEISDDTTHVSLESELLEKKVFLVLDDVSSKKQIQALLGNHSWIRKGSRIVITTRDRTSISQFEPCTYAIPRLDLKDGLKRFSFYAFKDHECPSSLGLLMDLSTKFVDYARGNPLALKILGQELLSKGDDHWLQRLDTLAQIPSPCIQDLLRKSYDELSELQKEAFLVVACFFRSGDEYYIRSLVDSEGASEIRDLADKLLISISSGQVEMHDLFSTFAKKLCLSLSSDNSYGNHIIWGHESFAAATNNKETRIFNQHPRKKYQPNLKKKERNNVIGISLDMSELTDKLTLDSETFNEMCKLRYLKVYNSQCSRDCDVDCKLNFPDGLKCSMENLHYLYWLQFPLKKLPKAINPKNLIELSLPYSKITRLWKDKKDTSKLKWVDLSNSKELSEISGLLGARNVRRLNLEGCTGLATIPEGIQEMESLVYLNLGGCTRLVSLPNMKLKSLKTLILSYCFNLEEFPLVSESIEALYLQGTAIKNVPSSIENLENLFLLNMKDCKSLVSVPYFLGKIRALRELILSGCSKLEIFPELKENIKSIKILLLDGTAIKHMPMVLYCSKAQALAPQAHDIGLTNSGVSCSLLSLCLSGTDLESLHPNISQLYHLKWLDLKNCKKIKSVPILPPNLKCFDAHGCDSLEKVGSPLAILMATGKINCTLIFTNCKKLDQVAKSSIISYTRRKSKLMSDALNRYNGGFVLESLVGTCFPGCEVPSSFDHQAFGSLLETKLPRHWCETRLTGIVLCAVILSPENQHQSNRFLVKCKCEFKTEDGPCISFTSIVGGWIVQGDEPRMIESDHVFIGYTSWLDIDKRHVEEHGKGCIPSKASLKFQVVTDGASEVVQCQVMKCGFALVYTPNDMDDIYEETVVDVFPKKKKDKEELVDIANSNKPRKIDYELRHQLKCGVTSRKDEYFHDEEYAEVNTSTT